jgi:hypothetical protein
MDVNRHHAIWPRRKQHTPLERAFRTHEGLVIPDADIQAHRELHVALPPPPKITRQLMVDILDVLNSQPLQRTHEGLEVVISHLESTDSTEALRLAKHFTKQLGYLTFQPNAVHVEGVMI